ncbi:hypothetical protein MBM_01230 [Drepanopeziza brunnea f. sp. 'multigermtubi' MB_m1]|uniref:Uncharacterized protein n=1 Tax=Marssonina brunnea f. sp. multigermtubi (strain MB_m1) TaxID=1072389 RepID=K1XIJ7_MARBU|nr:uncharacterized protein MBM_01230 [Drepanopeziza brunnea f. sp. 'multigermtubi' MB_m1]EKD20548.1 hypothetical protein MBM_01230 [Drepanopeziza brunnea f. sp. 'multigermtubi' MB_m1]
MAIQQRASGLYSRVRSLVDNYIISPSSRERYYKQISAFVSENPILSTFLGTQLVFSIIPLILFITFSLGVFLLALVSTVLFILFWTGVLLLALISAALFVLFWVVTALLVLIPVLLIMVSLGLMVAFTAVSSYFVTMKVFGAVPEGRKEAALPNGKVAIVEKNGEGLGDVNGEVKG